MVFDAEIGKRDWICKGESGDDGHWLCWWMVLVLGQAQGLQRCSKGLAKSSKVYVCIYIYIDDIPAIYEKYGHAILVYTTCHIHIHVIYIYTCIHIHWHDVHVYRYRYTLYRHMQQKHTVQVSELAACATPNTWRGNKPSHGVTCGLVESSSSFDHVLKICHCSLRTSPVEWSLQPILGWLVTVAWHNWAKSLSSQSHGTARFFFLPPSILNIPKRKYWFCYILDLLMLGPQCRASFLCNSQTTKNQTLI